MTARSPPAGGELQAYAQLRGRPRRVNDSWIAACCLVRDLPLWFRARVHVTDGLMRAGAAMSELDLSAARWRKSTRSTAEHQCVEVATLDGVTAVRDSKHPTGQALIFTPAEWTAFTAAVRDGEFD